MLFQSLRMKTSVRTVCLASVLVAVALTSTLVIAQYQRRGRGRPAMTEGRVFLDRRGVPNWEMDKEFPDDCFTFVRIQYNEGASDKWATDYPDAELNMSYRLQQLTSLKVNPNPIVLKLTDKEIFDHPFLYFIEPGGGGYRGYQGTGLNFSEEELAAFRKYLLNGGFAMFDDFWGEGEWDVFYDEIKRVFPDREPEELPLEHPIFHCVYDLKEKPQVPSIHAAQRGGVTYERWDAQEVHYKGIFDDKGRLMVLVCHNTDLGDGWEREGEDEWYFREFSEKKSYPMGINIIFYAMTH